jgi:hypothetical protein
MNKHSRDARWKGILLSKQEIAACITEKFDSHFLTLRRNCNEPFTDVTNKINTSERVWKYVITFLYSSQEKKADV